MIFINVTKGRFILPFVFFICFSSNILAQLEISKWLFSGNYATGIPLLYNFDTLPPSLQPMIRKMNFHETNSSICDKNGKILFYTNGIWIANTLNDTLLNGGRINPGNFPSSWVTNGLPEIQGTLILPFPEDSTKYYLFHNCPSLVSPNYDYPLRQYYSIIDMSADSGKGAVIGKNIILINDTIHGGELTACRHGNGRDWWILIHQFRTNLFYKILITLQGPSVVGIQNIGTLRNLSSGQSCFSPNGKWYAQYSGDTEFNLYKFDRCTGMLSNFLHTQFPDSYVLGGVAFSSSSNFLYVTTPKTVYQFNLLDTNIISSQQIVAQWDSTYSPNPPFATSFHLMQLMRDGKIYIIPPNATYSFHRINYPDSLGVACNVEQHFNNLSNFNAYTIPNFPNYYLGADSGSVCDTLQLTIKNLEFRKQKSVIQINPNPADDYFYINYDLNVRDNAMFVLYDGFGNEVLRRSLYGTMKTLLVHCEELVNGVYFYTSTVRNEIVDRGKVVVVK